MGQLSVDDVTSVLNRASIVLVPSRAIEGFSLVALEAAHLGRPVIGTRVGGLTETIEDDVTGAIVPPDDPAAMAAAIKRLLDPLRGTLGHRASSGGGWRARKPCLSRRWQSRFRP
jgi:glycosyltransferase involved in cell wall biosynthesis